MSVPPKHLSEELGQTGEKLFVTTRYGKVTGGRAPNGVAAFLEIPYALPPTRFEDPEPLPPEYKYENKEYIYESQYAIQPDNDGQAGDSDPRDKLGLGKPTENPLFLNIVTPASFPSKKNFPVKVYIHGGFLQFGSPHALSGQAQYVAAEKEEIYVNPGYRLSAFGFLASDVPSVPGNFGFKDQWLALEWVQDNIAEFGGNPDDIQVIGLSAGAHSIHQLLHHVTLLPPGVNSPFRSAVLQSNAIATHAKTPSDLRPQYNALLKALDLDPTENTSLATLKSPSHTTAERIIQAIATSLVEYGTFRGTSDGSFLPSFPSEMARQASPAFAQTLRRKGVRSIIIGDLTEEWYLYSIAHPINNSRDIEENLKRYYPDEVVRKLLNFYGTLPVTASKEQCAKLFGEILSEAQVHLPVRMLHRDLQRHEFPVLRYQIRWTPPQSRPGGYVTHGTDRPIWAFRRDILTDEQVPIARAWLKAVDVAIAEIEYAGFNCRTVNEILTLREDGTIGWTHDERWQEMERLAKFMNDNPGPLMATIL